MPLPHRYSYRLARCRRLRCGTKTEISLTRLPSRRLWILFRLAFGERGRTTTPLQLLDFGLQPLVHAAEFDNDLNQIFPAELFQLFQDPGCTISAAISRFFFTPVPVPVVLANQLPIFGR
jgi:hypothetical protein